MNKSQIKLTAVLLIVFTLVIILVNPFGFSFDSTSEQTTSVISQNTRESPRVELKPNRAYEKTCDAVVKFASPEEKAREYRLQEEHCGPNLCGQNGDCYLYQCFCDPGYSGKYCENFDESKRPGPCNEETWDDSCFYSEEYGVPKVSHDRWLKASSGELAVWLKLISLSDDRGDEHTAGFGRYAAVGFEMGDTIEVGCGPFTQMRNLINQQPRNFKSMTLLDPLLMHYFKSVNHCAYKSGKFMDFEYTQFIQSGGEGLSRIYESYDTLMMMNVIEHVENVYSVLENIYNVLRPGGTLIIHERWWSKYHPHKQYYVLDQYKKEHPVRIRENIWLHFKNYFQIIYDIPATAKAKIAPSVKPAENHEEGSYTILKKLTVEQVMALKQKPIIKYGYDKDLLLFHVEASNSALETINSIVSTHEGSNIKIMLYSPAGSVDSKFNEYIEKKYLEVVPLDLKQLSKSSALQDWTVKLDAQQEARFSSLLKLLVLYKHGGVYVPPGTKLTTNVTPLRNIIKQRDNAEPFMKFNKQHPFLNFVMIHLQSAKLDDANIVNRQLGELLQRWELHSDQFVVHVDELGDQDPEKDLTQYSSLYNLRGSIDDLLTTS
jgi:ubiquinone/menaquinone biosynthesis C-methylase UbiE